MLLVVAGVVSVQVGAAFAKGLFDEVSPSTLVWLRLAFSTVVLLLVARPRLRGRSRRDWLVVLGFGLALGTMNWAIYQSFARIPLGIAVTIEFVGPLGVALAGSRRARDLLWVGLAGLGVVLLGVERADLDPLGVGFALLAGAAWAAYILLSQATGARWQGVDGLALASLVAVLPLTPYVLLTGGEALVDPRILALGLAIGLLSSVVPYTCELVALRTLPSSTFGILMSLEPAAAALAAIVVLGELLEPTQWAAVACVVVAVAGATASSARAARPLPAAPAPD
ncbi:EamA family transporter [Nocardioides lentus]|uniref:EamA family transporter n=1 Tax=Nocardioides lentus TaxID=338077 RepID=A0ABP5B0V0_9ACTN